MRHFYSIIYSITTFLVTLHIYLNIPIFASLVFCSICPFFGHHVKPHKIASNFSSQGIYVQHILVLFYDLKSIWSLLTTPIYILNDLRILQDSQEGSSTTTVQYYYNTIKYLNNSLFSWDFDYNDHNCNKNNSAFVIQCTT